MLMKGDEMRANNLLRTACLFAAMGCMQAQASGERDLGRETLHPGDGWAANATGVIGGSAALPEQVYVVTNRGELIAASNNGVVSSTSPATPSNEPKIIYVKGTIDANVDDANNPLIEDFLATYDPAVWGRVDPDFAPDAGWIPVLNHQLLPAWTAPILVPMFAGPMPW